MSGDMMSLAGQVFPSVVAAIKAFGSTVLSKGEEAAADASVGLGRRILQRIFGHQAEGEAVPEAVEDLASAPDDGDLRAVLRVEIRKALEIDPQLAADLAAMLQTAAVTISAEGHGPVVSHSQIGKDNIQIGQAGGDVWISRE